MFLQESKAGKLFCKSIETFRLCRPQSLLQKLNSFVMTSKQPSIACRGERGWLQKDFTHIGAWAVQLLEVLTLNIHSGHDPKCHIMRPVMRPSPTSGFPLSLQPAYHFLCLSLCLSSPLLHTLSLSLSLSLKSKKKKNKETGDGVLLDFQWLKLFFSLFQLREEQE